MAKISTAYQESYRRLNPEQRVAVDTVEGPVLVIAGPGTGKTQLLSTRVGRILETTDSAPENILCLTFSEAAAGAMQQRLHTLIDAAAYRVTVSTFHGFGNDLINRYPELFSDSRKVSPADDLTRFKLLRTILDSLDYDNPLRSDDLTHDLLALFSAYKKAMITPEILQEICRNNLEFIQQAGKLLDRHVQADARISQKQLPGFIQLAEASRQLPDKAPTGITPLKTLWIEDLDQAIETAQASGKMTALSQWKINWLTKNNQGHKLPKGEREAVKHLAAADIFKQYLERLQSDNYIDFDDMIIKTITGLKTHQEVLYEIQEQYQYVLVDEFQDTNAAQLELVELILNNPVNEGRPNILAVGDDNQSVYSFQGAHYSQMERFYNNYRDIKLINLVTNYRSTPGIVAFGSRLRSQLQDGLKLHNLPAEAANRQAEKLLRADLPLRQDQLAWAAEQISRLIKQGSSAREIAVLSTRHRLLQDFLPYLHARNIAANYILNDNILDDPRLEAIVTMAQLALHLSNRSVHTDFYWQRVLSYDFWQLPTSLLWELSWNDRPAKLTDRLLAHPLTKPIALFFIRLSQIASITPLASGLNYLTGIESLTINEPGLKTFLGQI